MPRLPEKKTGSTHRLAAREIQKKIIIIRKSSLGCKYIYNTSNTPFKIGQQSGIATGVVAEIMQTQTLPTKPVFFFKRTDFSAKIGSLSLSPIPKRIFQATARHLRFRKANKTRPATPTNRRPCDKKGMLSAVFPRVADRRPTRCCFPAPLAEGLTGVNGSATFTKRSNYATPPAKKSIFFFLPTALGIQQGPIQPGNNCPTSKTPELARRRSRLRSD